MIGKLEQHDSWLCFLNIFITYRESTLNHHKFVITRETLTQYLTFGAQKVGQGAENAAPFPVFRFARWVRLHARIREFICSY
jgi:hypothetical protein